MIEISCSHIYILCILLHILADLLINVFLEALVSVWPDIINLGDSLKYGWIKVKSSKLYVIIAYICQDACHGTGLDIV